MTSAINICSRLVNHQLMIMTLEEIIDDLWPLILSQTVSNHSSREESAEKNTCVLPKLSVCGWLRIWYLSFRPVQLKKTTQTQFYCISQSLFRSHWIICMLLIYSNSPGSQSGSHSDWSLAGIWGYLSEINLRLTEHQFFIFRLIEIKNSEELQPYSW